MRVVLTVNFSPWSAYGGGGQRSTHNLAVALARRGHRVTVVYTRAVLDPVELPAGLPYEVVWAGFFGLRARREAPLRPLNALTVARAVGRLALRDRLEVVHGQGEEAALVPALRPGRGRFRFVMTPRYPALPAPLLAPGGPGPAALARLALTDAKYLVLGEALRRADAVCPTSRSAADRAVRAYGLEPGRVKVVPNGVDEAFLDARWSPVEAPPEVVFFGRLARGKGVDVLVEALGLLGDGAPACRVVGRGELEPELRRRVGALGLADRVRFETWLAPAELARLLARSALAVLPSREESFGNAMAEALAVGVPLVSTTAGSIPEVVSEGRTGLLVPPGDPAALAAAMAALLADPARAAALGEAGREEVRARFTWDAAAAAFEPIYRGDGAPA